MLRSLGWEDDAITAELSRMLTLADEAGYNGTSIIARTIGDFALWMADGDMEAYAIEDGTDSLGMRVVEVKVSADDRREYAATIGKVWELIIPSTGNAWISNAFNLYAYCYARKGMDGEMMFPTSEKAQDYIAYRRKREDERAYRTAQLRERKASEYAKGANDKLRALLGL